ncbi:hypothetical protein NESM_000491400 [Novymonas esmeraldas]|uniref:IQ motif and ubiquitin-like domain-containing protein n=1 Tax=Novymonas esmeraldas TaxID=1808958 RepID=A0AAW0ENC5_9TRYP
MDNNAEHVDDGPPPSHPGSGDVAGDGAPTVAAAAQPVFDDGADGDGTAVGHEVAAPRPGHHEAGVAHYARLQTAEAELADNVASDVRVPPTSSAHGELARTPEYEDIPPQQSGATAPASTVALARQPAQGIQVDAGVDVAAHQRDGGGQGTQSSDAAEEGVAADAAAVAPQWSCLPQAPHGTTEVTVTVLPIGAVTRLTVPVRSPGQYRPTGAEAAVGGTAAHWLLVAKDLYEAIAEHLLVHPQTLRIFHQHKRLRFMGTLFLESDLAYVMARHAGAGGDGDRGAVNDRAEPVWVSVSFPAPDGTSAAAHATAAAAAAAAGGGDGEEAEEAHASLMAVPPHLCNLGPNDYIARCIRVRPRKLEVPPRTLVEGRRQGFTYDEVIQRMQALQDTQQLPTAHGDGDDPAAAEAPPPPSFAIVAVLQDSPAPPGTAFLGGYRDKRNPEHVRLHASTQLYHRDLEYSPFSTTAGGAAAQRCTRQTQTMGISRSCQTHREVCVQTPRVDLHLDTSHDFVVVARPYFTAAELQALRIEMAIIIQKMYRQWKARRIRAALEVAEAARQHRAGARQRREEALQMAVEDAAQLRRDDPRSAADFERVKQDILNWRADEAARIQRNVSMSPAEVRAALLALTETELQLLQQLDQRRREVGKTHQEKRFVQTLHRMAAPKQWGTVYVRTPETERAAELRDLYERLCLTSSGWTAATARDCAAAQSLSSAPGGGTGAGGGAGGGLGASSSTSAGPAAMTGGRSVTSATASRGANMSATVVGSAGGTVHNAAAGLPSATAARLDILLRVKWTVREFSAASSLTQELCELIDREADLLHRGRKEASLVSLRKRIQSLFAQFIEDPVHNPAVREYARTALDRARVAAVAERSLGTQASTWKGKTARTVQ